MRRRFVVMFHISIHQTNYLRACLDNLPHLSSMDEIEIVECRQTNMHSQINLFDSVQNGNGRNAVTPAESTSWGSFQLSFI